MEILERDEYIFSANLNDGTLKALFFCHPNSAKLIRRFSTVFVMDCTYKVNKFNMPLLNIVGITATNHSFNAAFAFLSNECEASYEWVLRQFSAIVSSPTVIVTDRELAIMNAIKIVFPGAINILCIWHIEKNILSHCKPSFPNEDIWNDFLQNWSDVVFADSEEMFSENFQLLRVTFGELYPSCVDYLERNWIPRRFNFARAWIGKHPHLGIISSSRAEGIHFVTKNYVNMRKHNLLTVHEKLSLMLRNQFTELSKLNSRQSFIKLHGHNIKIFKKLLGNISHFALDLLSKEYAMIGDNTACTGLFSSTYGMPCRHALQTIVQTGMEDDPSSIHSQWSLILHQSIHNGR